MSYSTQANLVSRYGETELIQLTDRDNVGAIDAAVVSKAIADADALIDSYASAKYAVPLSPVPSTIERIACTLARYFLHDQAASDRVRKDYDDAIAFLKGVASGAVTLGVTAAGSAPAQTDGAQFEPGARVFARSDDGFL